MPDAAWRTIVVESGAALDCDFKKSLLALLHSTIRYKERTYSFYDGAEAFILDVLGKLKGEMREIWEVAFCPEENVL